MLITSAKQRFVLAENGMEGQGFEKQSTEVRSITWDVSFEEKAPKTKKWTLLQV